MTSPTVADIMAVMETIAPLNLAENWDNVGLQVGQGEWPVSKIWIALDPLPDVVEAAAQQKVDLLVTHHPLLFPHISQIDWQTPLGKILSVSRQHRLSIFAAHTNLDTATGGLNDQLAKLLQLETLKVLNRNSSASNVKLVVDVPAGSEQRLWEVLFAPNTDMEGQPPSGFFGVQGSGILKRDRQKRSKSAAQPLVRSAFTIQASELQGVIHNLTLSFSEDEFAYEVYPLAHPSLDTGLGRIGVLAQATTLEAFATRVKTSMGLSRIRIAGRSDLRVRKVAVCTGSGSELFKDFVASGADVYVSGDLKYHDARAVEALDRGLIDIGHFASEHIVVGWLTQRLQQCLDARGIPVSVEACALERDPFWAI